MSKKSRYRLPKVIEFYRVQFTLPVWADKPGYHWQHVSKHTSKSVAIAQAKSRKKNDPEHEYRVIDVSQVKPHVYEVWNSCDDAI